MTKKDLAIILIGIVVVMMALVLLGQYFSQQETIPVPEPMIHEPPIVIFLSNNSGTTILNETSGSVYYYAGGGPATPEGECVLDGRYYPVSSGKCTTILTSKLVDGGGMGGKVSLFYGNESVCTIPDTNNPGGAWMMPCKEAEKYSGVALKDGVSTLVKKEEHVNYTVTTFSGSGSETWTVPEGVTCIDYLIVDGLDIGGEIISGCTNSTISESGNGSEGGSGGSVASPPEIPLYSEPEGTGGGGGEKVEPTPSDKFTFDVVAVAGGGGGTPIGMNISVFNQTACNESSKEYGVDCDCFSCGIWFGVHSGQGFWNTTGVYYSDGTPTGKTMKQMDCEESRVENLRYAQFMGEHGVYIKPQEKEDGC